MERDSTGNWEERPNSLLANTRCSSCFTCCFGSRRSTTVGGVAWWERVRATSSSWSESHSTAASWSAGDRWWTRGFMRAREWSEIVAGPRWKTFIRRFSRSRSSGSSRHAAGKYQYDPLSYALNFDEGPGQNGDFEDEVSDGFRNFSARYAVTPPLKFVDSGQDVVVSG